MKVLHDRRRYALPPEMLARILVAWLAICAVLLATNIGAILALRFPGPDDLMRLLQVRDLLAEQAWFDLAQHRVDSPNGGVLAQGSRLVDLPLAASITILTPFLGQAAAEMAALTAVPLATFGIALLLAARVVWRLVGEEAAGLACLAMALSVPVMAEMRPLSVDGGGWQIVFALSAVNGLMARDPRTGGWVIGLSLAAWLAISLEGAILAAVFCAIPALRWLRNRQDSAWLVHTMLALTIGSALLFALTRGFGTLAPGCETISLHHIASFGLAALGAGLMSRLEPMPRFALLTGWSAIMASGAAILWVAAPGCFSGGSGATGLTPLGFDPSSMGNGLPLWQLTPGIAIQSLATPLIALFAALQLAGRSGGWLRHFWSDYALLLACALGATVFDVRAGPAAGALAAIPLGWQIREWTRAARHIRRPGRKALAMAAMAVALLPSLPLSLAALTMPARAAAAVEGPNRAACALHNGGSALRNLPSGEILAPVEAAPAILQRSGHSVVAVASGGGEESAREVMRSFTATPDAARALLKMRGTSYVALCPGLAEFARYAAAAPDGLAAHLLRGRAPDWLEPVELDDERNFKVWKIRR